MSSPAPNQDRGYRLAVVFGVQTATLVPACLGRVLDARGLHSPRWADLGTGDGAFLKLILERMTESCSHIRPFGVCVDGNDCDSLPPPAFCYKNELLSRFVVDSLGASERFDVVSLFEVIEHFDKDVALDLLRSCASQPSRICVISTPNGFLRQDAETHPVTLASKPLQWHRCGFSESELHELGYSTILIKYYHIRPQGNERSFDCILAFSGLTRTESAALEQYVRWYVVRLLLNPQYTLRVLRSYLVAVWRAFAMASS